MVYKQILIPDKKNHSIDMPERFFGKKVEITVVEIEGNLNADHPVPPEGKLIDTIELFENFGQAPDFPSLDVMRQQTWPSKW